MSAVGPRLALPLLLAVLALPACSGFTRIDYTRLPGRAAWQRPDLVIEALAIRPGDHVVDLGSGEGYFLPFLRAAVGPEGRVTAVEVDAERIRALEDRVAEEGWGNVRVVRAELDDPRLPDAAADLILLVNTYHHIEERPAYFSRLRADLRPAGRVAVIDPDRDLRGLLALALDEGHRTAIADLEREMAQAGYRELRRFELLPVQIFALYAPAAADGR